MGEIKSSYEIALEKMGKMGVEDSKPLTEEQKERIASVRSEYDAKIAEKKILLKDEPELPDEIRRLERYRDEKIEKVHNESKNK
jgi:hypothetical protein